MPSKGNLIVLSGPSGTGKGTVCKKLFKQNNNITYSVSATTRSPRPGEKNGREYWFVNRDEFENMIAQNQLLEWADVYGNYYGTPLNKINELRAQGIDVLLEIDTQGALNVMKKTDDGVFIFLLPPSLTELEKRIHGRGTETDEVIKKRLDAAIGEIALGQHYDYLVVNKSIDTAVTQINAIIIAEKCKTSRNISILKKLENEEI